MSVVRVTALFVSRCSGVGSGLSTTRYRSQVCRDFLALQTPPYSSEQADEFDSAVAKSNRELHHVGSRRHKAGIPCVQLHGPLLPITTVRLVLTILWEGATNTSTTGVSPLVGLFGLSLLV